MSEPFVVGIDPGLDCTAVCCYWPTTGNVRMSCHKAGPPGDDLEHRIERYEAFVASILHTVTAHGTPALVTLEHYSFNSRQTRAWQTGEWGFLLRCRLYEVTGEPVEVPPKTLKQFATGKGNANKTMVIAALTKRYGIEYRTDDEYDAYALARLAACLAGLEDTQTAWQAKALRLYRVEPK